MFGTDVVSILLGGISAGMVLFIVSVGLSVTMGLMGFVNLAHGAFAMLGGYVIVLAMNRLNVGFTVALALGFIVTAAVSAALERLFYRRLYRAAELDQVLFTIGLVFVFIASITLTIGPENQPLTLPQALQGQLDLGFIRYRTYSIFLIVVGALIALGLWLGFERTRIGAQIPGRPGAMLLGVHGKGSVGAALSEKAADQRDQFVYRSVSTQEFRPPEA